MKNLLICLLLLLPLHVLQAQDIHFGARLQGQLGAAATAYVPAEVAHGINAEVNLNIALNRAVQFETGLGVATRAFQMRYLFDQDDLAPDANYQQNSQVLTLPARFRFHSRISPQLELFLNLGYQYGHVLADQTQITWDAPPFEGQSIGQVINGSSEHGIDVGLEMEMPLGDHHRVGLGLNYQMIQRAMDEERYSNVRFHLAGFSIRFARRVHRID